MTDGQATAILALIARTCLRIEHHVLRIALEDMTDNDVLAHNDECIRLRGIIGGEVRDDRRRRG